MSLKTVVSIQPTLLYLSFLYDLLLAPQVGYGHSQPGLSETQLNEPQPALGQAVRDAYGANTFAFVLLCAACTVGIDNFDFKNTLVSFLFYFFPSLGPCFYLKFVFPVCIQIDIFS